MRIKANYVLKTIGSNIVVVPLKEEALRFNGIISLNKTGQFLFELLQKEDLTEVELLSKVLDKYEVDELQASKDIKAFINECKKNQIINE
jgi:hypothetical protein